eukprot:gene880-1375_t
MAPACARGIVPGAEMSYRVQHPWLTRTGRQTVQRRVSPHFANTLLHPCTGQLTDEIVAIGVALRIQGDCNLYARSSCHNGRARSQRMSKSLTNILDACTAARDPLDACADDLCDWHSGQANDVDDCACLLLSCAHVVLQEGLCKLTPYGSAFPCERNTLYDIVETGSLAAVDGELHVVRACIFAYSDHVDSSSSY